MALLVKSVNSVGRKTYELESHGFETFRTNADSEIADVCKQDDHRDKLVISVIDTGSGIQDADLPKLFKLFGKLSSTE